MNSLRGIMHNLLLHAIFAVSVVVCSVVSFSCRAEAGRIVSIPVTSIVLYPGDAISDSVLVMRKWRSRKLGTLPVIRDPSKLRGRVALRTILPGRPIFLNSVGIPDVIKQGSLVVVQFKVGTLAISSRANALQSGKTGDMITLRNIETGRVITGRVGADKIVRVDGQ